VTRDVDGCGPLSAALPVNLLFYYSYGLCLSPGVVYLCLRKKKNFNIYKINSAKTITDLFQDLVLKRLFVKFQITSLIFIVTGLITNL
jgi:hypothetical protein